MQTKTQEAVINSNYALKHNKDGLLNASSRHVDVALNKLEAIRTSNAVIPASKFGLEAICGASCETGAL